MEISLNWTEFKQIAITNKHINPQYQDKGYGYFIWGAELCIIYTCNVDKTDPRNADQIDFEDNYKTDSNSSLEPKDSEGKLFNRAESRPLNCTTCFTTCGDTNGGTPVIGGGNRLAWDASVASGWVDDESGAPEGMKQFSVTIQFCDSIWLKEGTIYYMDCDKGSYIDMEVLCPNGGYYMYMGQVYQNTTGNDLVVDHYLFKHPMQDNVPMGDELNTETCSQELPSYLKFKLIVTVPEADVTSYGYMEIEVYRIRTVVIS
jgi:hypothetical protein